LNGTGRKWGRMATFLVAATAVLLPGRAGAEEPARLEPIVVTAARIEQRVSEQASAVSVVEEEEIRLKQPAVAGDILQGIPGCRSARCRG